MFLSVLPLLFGLDVTAALTRTRRSAGTADRCVSCYYQVYQAVAWALSLLAWHHRARLQTRGTRGNMAAYLTVREYACPPQSSSQLPPSLLPHVVYACQCGTSSSQHVIGLQWWPFGRMPSTTSSLTEFTLQRFNQFIGEIRGTSRGADIATRSVHHAEEAVDQTGISIEHNLILIFVR